MKKFLKEEIAINNKNFSNAILALLINGSLFVMPVASAEIYTADGEYTMSKYETVDIAEQRAIKDAMRHAQEQAGIYIESYSRMKNFQLLEDEVITIASGVLKFVEKPIIQTKIMEDGKSFKIFAKIKIEIADGDIEKWLNNDIEKRQKFHSQLETLRKANEEQEKRIKKLEAQIAAGLTLQQEEKIKEEFQNEDKNFLSNQNFTDGFRFFLKEDYNTAMKFLNQSIELNPRNADSYSLRSLVHLQLNNYSMVIEDMTKAISLGDVDGSNYFTRGISYFALQDYEKSISDFTRVIKSDIPPKSKAIAYFNRGRAYFFSMVNNSKDLSIQDFTSAISIMPDYTDAYFMRSYMYSLKNDYTLAIYDLNSAIVNFPENAHLVLEFQRTYNKNLYLKLADVYSMRADNYREEGNYLKAIKDYDMVIKLNPNCAEAYTSRAYSYVLSGNSNKAIIDFTKAIEINSYLAVAYYGRGICYQNIGEIARANSDFAKAKELGFKEN